MQEETNRFLTRADDGRQEIVVEMSTVIEFNQVNGPKQRRYGTREYFLADGTDVNYVDEKRFQNVENDEFLTRV